MVVESKVAGIEAQHFPDLGLKGHTLVDEADAKFLRCTRYQFAILEEDFCGRETVWPQDELALKILNVIEWTSVAVLTLFEVAKPRLMGRAAKRTPFECIALVLQGGGALGSYQGGVYQALAEVGLQPDWIAGVSQSAQ